MKLEYSHYSPYQFSTTEQLAESRKEVVDQKKLCDEMCMKRKRETQNLGSTIPVELAHRVSSLPNAYISPNSPDVMRQIKSVFGF
jgi:hypothetical protein